MNSDEQVRQLEDIIAKFLKPIRGVPYAIVIEALTGHSVTPFTKQDPHDIALLNTIKEASEIAGRHAKQSGIFRARPNEVGNAIEPYVKEALLSLGLQAITPSVKGVRRQVAGYPDLEITDKYGRTSYLECKTYNLKNVDTTQRAFYFSPPTKVSKDARHLLLTYQIETATRQGKSAFVPVHWRIYSLDGLKVDLKYEFNASNQEMYGRPDALLAEGNV